jgi:hypothetical protein
LAELLSEKEPRGYKGGVLKMKPPIDRHEYGRMYNQLFKNSGREDCRQGWDRWQEVWTTDYVTTVLHPHDASPPAPQPDDYWIFATAGPLRFVARCSAAYLPNLLQIWPHAVTQAPMVSLLKAIGDNPRSRARAFVHNSLVDGRLLDPVIAPAMAGAIAWLLESMERAPVSMQLSEYHMFGYDITHVPRPPGVAGHHTMFNFRAILQREPGDIPGALDIVRSAPLPEWRPPPH